MTLGSLFSGSGGFELGAILAGIEPKWASEVEPFPIRVTTKRLPSVKHLGDIHRIHGDEIEPVDIITFGSPCTNLSIAGRREGLHGQESILFFEAIRIVQEMRCATNGRYPRFIVWENVAGAFSSSEGRDFQSVLTEIVRIKEPEAPEVPLPQKGGWTYADILLGDGWSVAYRLMDAQGWGVPQVGAESTLSQILEDQVPDKYYLTPKACVGILRRASLRGKALPESLRMALKRQAGG